MTLQFSRSTALTLFCVCRQAERSVGFALTCPKQWAAFVAFYDKQKQSRISEFVGLLNKEGGEPGTVPTRDSFPYTNVVVEMVTTLVRMVVNRRKKVWTFSSKEASFITASLEKLLGILGECEFPPTQGLIDLRMDLYQCEWILERKLIGLPELRLAATVEHFNQSEYRKHVTIQELIGSWRSSGKEPITWQPKDAPLSFPHAKPGKPK